MLSWNEIRNISNFSNGVKLKIFVSVSKKIGNVSHKIRNVSKFSMK
jgi:hypothetical protein